MAASLAVIVTVDGLRADAVGAYGNAQAMTPFLDRLAAESVLYDFAFSLDGSLTGFFEAAWRGVHPGRQHFAPTDDAALPGGRTGPLSEGVSHHFITDQHAAAEIDVERFAWARVASGESFFPAAAQHLTERFQSAGGPQVGWVHTSLTASGVSIESRQQYDTLVTAIDDGIRTLFADLSFPDETDEVLFLVAGCRGYALGEHGCVGNELPILHEELLHVPLIVYSQPPLRTPLRIGRLTSPLEVHASLKGLLLGPDGTAGPTGPVSQPAGVSEAEADSLADCLFFANSLGHQAIRTPGWYLIRRPPLDEELAAGAEEPYSTHLYLKPDDRWEVNEVSSLRPEIVEALNERLEALVAQASSGTPLRLPTLPPEIMEGA